MTTKAWPLTGCWIKRKQNYKGHYWDGWEILSIDGTLDNNSVKFLVGHNTVVIM